MDGNRPEATGDAKSVDSRSRRRGPQEPVSYTHDASGQGETRPSGDFPSLDWALLSRLSVAEENACLSLHDGNGVFLEVAGGCETVWNQSANEIRNLRVADLVEPDLHFSRWLSDLKAQSQDKIFAVNVIRGDSPPVPLSLKRVALFMGAKPHLSRILIKAVAAQADSCASLTFRCRPDGELIDANGAWRRVLGLPQPPRSGQSLFDFIHETDRARLSSFLELLQSSRESESRIFRFRTSQRAQRSLLLTGEAASDTVQFLARDITLDSPSSLQRILNTLSVSCLAWVDLSQSDCAVSHASYAFEKLTGFGSVDRPSLLDLLSPANDESLVSRAISSIKQGREDTFELLIRRSNGGKFWGELKTFPLRDEAGDVHYTAFAIEDITQEKESQKNAIQQENLRSLGQMASGIAHDFNNLLAPILGFSELLLNMPEGGRDDAKLVSFLEKIKVAAQDGAAVVGRLREFYSTQDSVVETTTDIDLHALADQVRDLTQHRWKSQAEARGANIEFRTAVTSHRCVHGNEPELRQALSNLVINAVDAIEGNGAISLSISDADEDVLIEIKDTGCGMPESIRAKCLDPFYSTKGKLGTGLGLSIVAGVVKRHGGAIEIHSEEGTGSTVSIHLPAVEARLVEPAPKAAPRSSSSLRIMLVDDEAVLLEVLSELLGSGGHKVENFESGEAALKAFQSKRFDLVITDRAMPNMSGEQLAAEIKSINPHTPIIMATGFGDTMSSTDKASSHVDLVLAKPVPLDVLNQKLSELTARELN